MAPQDLRCDPPEINEDEGEILCDKCEGRGCDPIPPGAQGGMTSVCQKCQGGGKLDWVSFITGKPKPPQFHFSSSSTSWSGIGTATSSAFPQKIVDVMAKKLAEKIDEEIMDNLLNPTNKHIKMYNREVKEFDNGIVSKQLLYPYTKQKLKG